jgi:hypothetical protein
MSRAANSLKTSDVITTPIKLKYESSFESASFAENGIRFLKGINGPVTITGSVSQETINYYSIRHLYYSNFLTGSFPVSASSADNFLQSTAASGSNDSDNRYFPTHSGAEITVLSIPRGVYGQQISRKSFILSSSNYFIVDDGNGNLVNFSSIPLGYIQNGYFGTSGYFVSGTVRFTPTPVGNIIYPQGMAIITNPDFQAFFR